MALPSPKILNRMPDKNPDSAQAQPETREALDIPLNLKGLLAEGREDNRPDQDGERIRESQAEDQDLQADEIDSVRRTLEAMDGKETTPANEANVREARKKLGEADLPPEEKQKVDLLQEQDGIVSDQVKDGRLNLNKVEAKIIELETHQRAERHHVILHRLNSRAIPTLAKYGIESISDVQAALKCTSQGDLIRTCENILKAASPTTPENFKSSDIQKSISNLKALDEILATGFKLSKEDADFDLGKFRIDPEAAVGAIRTAERIRKLRD